MERIVVFRFSAMGDVAMVASVLQELSKQQPQLEIIMVSRKLFKPFFEHIPNVKVHLLDSKEKHKGFFGLYKLFKELKTYKPTYIADLHNNLRSRIVGTFFNLSGYKVKVLDKGRKEKKALTRKENKIFKPLRNTTERYADVFRALGFPLHLDNRLVKAIRPIPTRWEQLFPAGKKAIGIAPFAQHSYKVFPLQKMESVVSFLSSQGYSTFIFGGGKQEQEIAETWSRNFVGVYNTIGLGTVNEELDLISHLDAMISMDSSGMHMASLVGTRCLSIWGATHPYAGFLGYGQSIEDCIQVEHANRPSSVFGNKPCNCDGVEAIDLVTAEMVIKKIESL